MNLQKLEVSELSLVEQQELDAGGWIRDAVAYVIGYYSCGCNQGYANRMDELVSYN